MSTAAVPEYEALTDVGRRENNEDSLATPQGVSPAATDASGWLFVVADGVGGHASGQVASAAAAKAAPEAFYQAPAGDTAAALERAVKLANEQVRQLAVQPENHGMATTMVAAVVQGDRLTVANVGDSRAYIYRGGRLRQITNDHSWVAEQVRLRVLTPEQAANHPYRNMISRALGQNADVEVDIFHERLRSGDQVLLCSDGLHGAVPDSDIERLLATSESAALAARRLVDLALENGGSDNITVIVVRAPLGTGRGVMPWIAGGRGAWLPKAAMAMVGVAVGGALLLAFLVSVSGPGPATPAVTPTATPLVASALTPHAPTVTLAPTPSAVVTATPSPVAAVATAIPAPKATATVTLPVGRPGQVRFNGTQVRWPLPLKRLQSSQVIATLGAGSAVTVLSERYGYQNTSPEGLTSALWYFVSFETRSAGVKVGFVWAPLIVVQESTGR